MLIELFALAGFLGVVGLTFLKVWILIQKDFWEHPKYSAWVSMLTLIGLIFFFGLFFVAYMSSFDQQTTLTEGNDVTTITSNDYLFLVYLAAIVWPLFWIGGFLNVAEFIYLLVHSGYSFAKNSMV